MDEPKKGTKITVTTVIVVILVILFLYWLFFVPPTTKVTKSTTTTENFNAQSQFPHNNKLSDYYNASEDINKYKVDLMPCHPSCCGSQWPVPFDGLTSEQIQQTLMDQQSGGQFMRTNYTCANGPNGVGCPCITKDAYVKLVNRGQTSSCGNDIDRSLYVDPHLLSKTNINVDMPQVYTNNRRMNDTALQRQQRDLSGIMSYGAPQSC